MKECGDRMPRIGCLFTALFLLGGILPLAGCVPPEKYAYERPEEELHVLDVVDEAEELALYLGDDIIPSGILMKRVFYDLSLIRGAFAGSVEAVGRVRFRPPCSGGRIMIVFDETSFASLKEGTYVAWSGLNDRYNPFEIKTVDRLRKVYLYFDGLYNLGALAGKYSGLEGVTSASCVPPEGDGPNIYARRTASGIDYLFRDAWSECSTGCSSNEFYFFICEGDDALFLGGWNPGESANPPEWWGRAEKCLPSDLADRF
jgi:hypothetical protein